MMHAADGFLGNESRSDRRKAMIALSCGMGERERERRREGERLEQKLGGAFCASENPAQPGCGHSPGLAERFQGMGDEVIGRRYAEVDVQGINRNASTPPVQAKQFGLLRGRQPLDAVVLHFYEQPTPIGDELRESWRLSVGAGEPRFKLITIIIMIIITAIMDTIISAALRETESSTNPDLVSISEKASIHFRMLYAHVRERVIYIADESLPSWQMACRSFGSARTWELCQDAESMAGRCISLKVVIVGAAPVHY